MKQNIISTKDSFLGIYFICLVASVFFVGFDIYFFIANAIFFYQALKLLFETGERLPIRSLIGTLFSLNYLFSPVLMYSWLNPFVEANYRIRGEPSQYFEYAIPGMALFLIGLNINSKERDENMPTNGIKSYVAQHPRLPLILIIIGVLGTVLLPLVPESLMIYFGALAHLKFAGIFLHIISQRKLNLIYFFLTFGLAVVEAVTTSMFNNLLNLLIFLGLFLAIRKRPSVTTKIFGFISIIAIVVFVQIIKAPLRDWLLSGNEVKISNFDRIVDEGLEMHDQRSFEGKVASIIFRLDQGWITSGVIKKESENGFELQNGQHMAMIIKSAILPRFLAPDKVNAGDITLYNKYSIHSITEGTSFALGIFSDAYIDFGYFGVLLLFFYGFLFNMVVRILNKLEQDYIFVKVLSPICLFLAVRPDTDSQNALGSLFKLMILIWIVSYIINRNYSFKKTKTPMLHKA